MKILENIQNIIKIPRPNFIWILKIKHHTSYISKEYVDWMKKCRMMKKLQLSSCLQNMYTEWKNEGSVFVFVGLVFFHLLFCFLLFLRLIAKLAPCRPTLGWVCTKTVLAPVEVQKAVGTINYQKIKELLRCS